MMSLQAQILPDGLQLFSLFLIIGALACRVGIVPAISPAEDAGAATRVRDRLGWLLGIALALLTVAAVTVLALRSASMSGQPFSQLLSVAPVTFQKTHFGHVWLIRGASILVLWGGWGLLKTTDKDRFAVLMLCAAAVTAWTLSAVGHAAGSRDFALTEWIDWLHVMSASLWGGSVMAALFALWPLRALPAHGLFIGQAVQRLSRLAAVAFLAVFASGFGSLLHQLSAAGDLFYTAYGRILLLKLVLVSAVLVVAAANRFLYLPGLRSASRIAATTGRVLAALALEAVLMIAILACVALLKNGPPPPASRAPVVPSACIFGPLRDSRSRFVLRHASLTRNRLHRKYGAHSHRRALGRGCDDGDCRTAWVLRQPGKRQ